MDNEDIPILDALHKKYYPEFENPGFYDKDYITRFIISGSEGIITGGGVRLVGEINLVTDKSQNVHSIGEALLHSLKISSDACKMRGIELLYAFIQDEKYKKHLINIGFDPIKGDPISLYLGKG
jgi:hypothetical protein